MEGQTEASRDIERHEQDSKREGGQEKASKRERERERARASQGTQEGGMGERGGGRRRAGEFEQQ